MKDDISQKTDGNMVFSVCSVKMVFLFLQIWNYPSVRKAKMIPKNKPKDDISGITEKNDIHPRKGDIGILDWHSRKISNDSLYFYGDFLIVLIYCFPMKKTPENLVCRIDIWLYL